MGPVQADNVAATRHTLGVISDTHGIMRPEALAALRGVDHILHAGDIGSPEVLAALQALAPVTAVRGNNDREGWARSIPLTALFRAGPHVIFLLHDLGDLRVDPRAAGYSAVVAGHSHKPRDERRDGVLMFNPGSAGPRRFSLPITVGRLHVDGTSLRGETIHLLEPTAR